MNERGVLTEGDPVIVEPGTQPPGGGGGDPMNPGGGAAGGANTPPAKPNRPARTGTVDITNLLPGDTTAVFHAARIDIRGAVLQRSDARTSRPWSVERAVG